MIYRLRADSWPLVVDELLIVFYLSRSVSLRKAVNHGCSLFAELDRLDSEILNRKEKCAGRLSRASI